MELHDGIEKLAGNDESIIHRQRQNTHKCIIHSVPFKPQDPKTQKKTLDCVRVRINRGESLPHMLFKEKDCVFYDSMRLQLDSDV